ncbi:MAG: DUF1353 domain-containing protein [Calditrichaeota bacterium]|nr:MAG: DUF1353 domain-containing protein [Calditrichota bacterium]
MSVFCYRDLTPYKYQLTQPYALTIDAIADEAIDTPFVRLSMEGKLYIAAGYAWDGPSGPTFDTDTFMRASLVHDALYQLMRLRKLPEDKRAYADELLYRLCIEDNMNRFRAWYVYKAVRWFGASNARPEEEKPVVVLCLENGLRKK